MFSRIKELWGNIFHNDHLTISEICNVGYSMAPYILKRLKAFKEYDRPGFPVDLNEEDWENILDEMIFAFSMMVAEECEERAEEFFKEYDCNYKEEKPENLHCIGFTFLKDKGVYLSSEDGEDFRNCFYFDDALFQKCLQRQRNGFKLFGEFYLNLWT